MLYIIYVAKLNHTVLNFKAEHYIKRLTDHSFGRLFCGQSPAPPEPLASALCSPVTAEGESLAAQTRTCMNAQPCLYCIAGKFGGKLNLAVWQSILPPSN